MLLFLRLRASAKDKERNHSAAKARTTIGNNREQEGEGVGEADNLVKTAIVPCGTQIWFGFVVSHGEQRELDPHSVQQAATPLAASRTLKTVYCPCCLLWGH